MGAYLARKNINTGIQMKITVSEEGYCELLLNKKDLSRLAEADLINIKFDQATNEILLEPSERGGWRLHQETIRLGKLTVKPPTGEYEWSGAGMYKLKIK